VFISIECLGFLFSGLGRGLERGMSTLLTSLFIFRVPTRTFTVFAMKPEDMTTAFMSRLGPVKGRKGILNAGILEGSSPQLDGCDSIDGQRYRDSRVEGGSNSF